MNEVRETEVARDPNTGRVTGYVEHIEKPRRKGGGGWFFGLILGIILVVGGIALYASKQGGYQNAGAQTDHALAQTESQASDAAQNATAQAGQAAVDVGHSLKSAASN